MRHLYIKDLDKVKAQLKEKYDQAWTMRYAVKAFIDTLKGYEDKPITQKALQEYYYKKDKYTRYVVSDDNYISFLIGKDIIGRKQLSIHGFKNHSYKYYDNVALGYELPLYDTEKYKTWGDVINELNRRLDTFVMPEYDEKKIEAEYAKCKDLADRWNEMSNDKNNIWNSVSEDY